MGILGSVISGFIVLLKVDNSNGIGKLREFAKAVTKYKNKNILDYLFRFENIENFIFDVTKNDITFIDLTEKTEIKKYINDPNNKFTSTAYWDLIYSYNNTYKGQIYFGITRENRVFMSKESLMLLNSYLIGFREETMNQKNTLNTQIKEELKYDVVLSFAGEQRNYVEEVSKYLEENNINYFYDENNKAELWGKNLIEEFDRIYSKESKYCLMFISKSYKDKMWPTLERRAALERNLKSKKEYILPIRFDDTEIDGLHTSIGYLDARKKKPIEIVESFLEIIGRHYDKSKKKKEFKFPPKIIRFEIIPNSVRRGGKAVYYWEVENIDHSIKVYNQHEKGGDGVHSFGKNYEGYYTVDNIQDSVKYTLTIANNIGKESKTIELKLENADELYLSHEKKETKNLELIQTIGGPGTGNGQFRFGGGHHSSGGLFIRDGILYVTDWINKRLQIFKKNPDGRWNYEKSFEGSESFYSSLFVSKTNDIYIQSIKKIYKYRKSKKPPKVIHVDIGNSGRFILYKNENIFLQMGSDINIIKKYSNNGELISEFGGFGNSDGKFDNEEWTADLVIDESGNIYILDVGNKRVQKFDNNGIFLKKWSVEINGYSQMAIDEINKVYVVENNYRNLKIYDSEGNLLNDFDIPENTVKAGSYIFIYKNHFFVSNQFNHNIKVFKINLK